MGQWHAGVGGAGQRGGDARHHLVGNAVRTQVFQLFAAAAEHERVAALEPHHSAPAAGMLEHQPMDLPLRGVVVSGLLADFDALGVAPRQRQHLGADQPVVQDHVGFVQGAQAAQGKQAQITRAGADQHDRAGGARRFGGQRLLRRHARLGCTTLAQQGRDRAAEQPLAETTLMSARSIAHQWRPTLRCNRASAASTLSAERTWTPSHDAGPTALTGRHR